MDLIGYDSRADMTDKLSLHTSIESLPEEEAKIIKLRYFSGMTQAQVAEILSLSQVQVSRKEKTILKKLRGII
jgi:RNA polymerase sporulation-specific sigma factor